MSFRQRRHTAELRRRSLFRWGVFAISICTVIQVGMHAAITKHQKRKLLSANNFGYYTSLEELQARPLRFPSTESRLKLYMTSWYLPPCAAIDQIAYTVSNEGEFTIQISGDETFILSRQPECSKHVFQLDKIAIERCHASDTNRFCDDAVRYYLPSLERLESGGLLPHDSSLPLILQFGDAEEWIMQRDQNSTKSTYPGVPVLKKFRYSLDQSTVQRLTEDDGIFAAECRTKEERMVEAIRGPRHAQAIITIVSNVHRHFGPLENVPKFDIPWSRKLNKAVYRGGLTGRNHRTVRHDAKKNHSSLQVCQEIPRCKFVLQHAESQLLDAKLVEIKGKGNFRDLQSINGVQLFGDGLSMEQMLQYKAIVMLEGNDVATGLKWALYSNSVVLMKRPTCTSWIMEELLEPYVHYVPIDDEDTVDEKVQWILDNDEKAQNIARRGKLWITDLLFHPDADQETEFILDETLRRYTAHFRLNQ